MGRDLGMKQDLRTPSRDRVARQLRDEALALFRGRNRECLFEWVDIHGMPFPHLLSDGLSMVLRTPFQQVDLLLPSTGRGRAVLTPPYGLDVFAGRKVFSVTWGVAGGLSTHLLIRGPWERALSRLAGATITGPGDVALRLATVRVAYLLASESGDGSRPRDGSGADPAHDTIPT